jgi:hypothetical protein
MVRLIAALADAEHRQAAKGAEILQVSGSSSCPYSPNFVEEKFCEVHRSNLPRSVPTLGPIAAWTVAKYLPSPSLMLLKMQGYVASGGKS